MHALHRFDLPRVMTVTVIAAVLAIVLTLSLATTLNDLASTRAPTGVAGAPTPRHAPSTRDGLEVSPFAPLLSAPPAAPWLRTRS